MFTLSNNYPYFIVYTSKKPMWWFLFILGPVRGNVILRRVWCKVLYTTGIVQDDVVRVCSEYRVRSSSVGMRVLHPARNSATTHRFPLNIALTSKIMSVGYLHFSPGVITLIYA